MIEFYNPDPSAFGLKYATDESSDKSDTVLVVKPFETPVSFLDDYGDFAPVFIFFLSDMNILALETILTSGINTFIAYYSYISILDLRSLVSDVITIKGTSSPSLGVSSPTGCK